MRVHVLGFVRDRRARAGARDQRFALSVSLEDELESLAHDALEVPRRGHYRNEPNLLQFGDEFRRHRDVEAAQLRRERLATSGAGLVSARTDMAVVDDLVSAETNGDVVEDLVSAGTKPAFGGSALRHLAVQALAVFDGEELGFVL